MLSTITEFERLHLIDEVRSGKAVDPRSYQSLTERLADENIIEKAKKAYNQVLYPLFEEYHIPKDFDSVIDNIAQTIRDYLVDYIYNSREDTLDKVINVNNLSKDEKSHLLNTSIVNFERNISITPYSYDIDKRECIKKNFADIDKDQTFKEDTQRQFPIVLYFYEDFRNIGISPEIIDVKSSGHKIRIVKFTISMIRLIEYLNTVPHSSIKTLVRHEILHIVERFVNNGKDSTFFLKRNEIAEEMFDFLKDSGYSYDEIISIDADILLFSDSEMSARVNELHTAIEEMTNEEIENLVRSDNSITMQAIMKLFKHFSKVSLVFMMDNFKDTVTKAINDPNSYYYREALGVMLANTEYKVFDIRNPKLQKSDEVLRIMKDLSEKVTLTIERFEMRCYKMIYHVLKEKKFDVNKSVLQENIEKYGRYTDLFESGLIYYMYDFDNNFGVL